MIISPGPIFVQKAILLDIFFWGGAYFWRGLLLEGSLHLKVARVGLDNRNSLKQLALTGGLIIGRIFASKILGRAYFREVLLGRGIGILQYL